MPSLCRLIALAAFLLATVAGFAGEQTPPVRVSALPAYAYGGEHLPLPVAVELTNTTSSDRAAEVEFSIGWRNAAHRSYSFFVPAGKTVREIVYPDNTGILKYRLAGSSSYDYISSRSGKKSGNLFIVLQEGLSTDWSLLSSSPCDANISTCDLMEWPADWRMYTSQLCLVIPEKEFMTRFDEAHRRAIRQWTLGGGNLWLVGERDRTTVEEQTLGRGRILRVPPIDGLDEKEKTARLESLVKRLAPASVLPTLADESRYALETPSVAIGLILVLFAALTGPVALFLWAPAGKRHRLFALIPGISAAFSLALLLLILIGDGTGGKGSRAVHILVNPEDHTGLILQRQICQTSVLANTAFSLPDRAILGGEILRFSDRGWTNLLYSGGAYRHGADCRGWFSSRSLLKHWLLLPISTRAALHLVETAPDGAPVFQSAFSSTLEDVTYADGKNLWRIGRLSPGGKAKAEPCPPSGLGVPPPIGHFQATLLASEGDEPGPIATLPSIRWENTEVTVSGPVAQPTRPLPLP